MNDEAFLETIRQNPEDDAPRLVYADWLEEQGDIRAEFLRLEVQFARMRGREPNRLEVRNEMKRLLVDIDLDWLAFVERTKRYTVYWSSEACRILATNGEIGRPLRFVCGSHNSWPPFRKSSVGAGHYLYPITVRNRRLMIIARMRVKEVASAELLRSVQPDEARLLAQQTAREVFIGDGGVIQRLDRVLPIGAVSRLRFAFNGKERGPKHLRDGELQHCADLQGILQITQRTAMDFERLLAGLPFPDLPEEVGLFT